MNLPAIIRSEPELDELLSRPSDRLVTWMGRLRSPLVVLGASGKMGPSLCRLARRAADAAQHPLRIIAVSRFSDPRSRQWLESQGIETLACDLLDRHATEKLPDCENLLYLVGLKFGTRQNPSLTWAVNTLAPAWIMERYPSAAMVALSTGNVYPCVPVGSGGATEETPPNPVGEYGNAALARERIFEHYSAKQKTPIVLLRLNYAVELRYGVLLDLAQKVWTNQAIDLATGHLNCLWQRDANEMILRSLDIAVSPPAAFNLTGSSTLSVRELAGRFGQLMEREPLLAGSEGETALLSNSSRLFNKLGQPEVPLDRVVKWTAHWVMQDGPTLRKPTHFDVRTGDF